MKTFSSRLSNVGDLIVVVEFFLSYNAFTNIFLFEICSKALTSLKLPTTGKLANLANLIFKMDYEEMFKQKK